MPSVVLVRPDAPPAEQPTPLPPKELALPILLRRLDTNERGMFRVPTNWVHELPELGAAFAAVDFCRFGDSLRTHEDGLYRKYEMALGGDHDAAMPALKVNAKRHGMKEVEGETPHLQWDLEVGGATVQLIAPGPVIVVSVRHPTDQVWRMRDFLKRIELPDRIAALVHAAEVTHASYDVMFDGAEEVHLEFAQPDTLASLSADTTQIDGWRINRYDRRLILERIPPSSAGVRIQCPDG